MVVVRFIVAEVACVSRLKLLSLAFSQDGLAGSGACLCDVEWSGPACSIFGA
jgi:hypothetical protein